MTAQEAKAMAFAKSPPVMPDAETMERIRYSASNGSRYVVINHIGNDSYDRHEFSTDEKNWLMENGYEGIEERQEIYRQAFFVQTTIRW